MASLSASVLFAVLMLVIGSTQSYAVSGFPSIDDHEERIHYNAPTNYKFSYGVNDPHTQDIKNQWEERDGDVVKGSYSLHESDGTVRIVEYTADNHNGFNAKVHKSGVATHSLDNNHFNH